MPSIRITALGRLAVDVDGRAVDWLASQRMRAACLVYLAIEREVSRDRLIGLFWPESDLERARRSLSQVVYTIRRSLGEATVITDGDRVRIGTAVDVDVVRFMNAVDAGDLETALPIYRGRLLADTTLTGTAAFEQWLDAKRAQIERTHRRARRTAIDACLTKGDSAAALRHALAWCELDPDEDEAHHRYIQLLIETGQRVEAIRHFEAYVAQLKEAELQPLDETVALIAGLREKQPAAPAPATRGGNVAIHSAAHDPPAAQRAGLQAFVDQLKRRRVIGALGLYLVIAWGAIEVSNTVFPLLSLPEWGPRLTAILAVIGFPFAAFFAWQYDLTAQGVERTTGPSHSVRARAFPKWAAGLLTVPIVLFGVWQLYARWEPTPDNDIVAVFPFCVAGEVDEGEAANTAVLLAQWVDLVPEMQSADRNLVIAAAERGRLNCRDAEAASHIARQFGAARFILGSMARTRDDVRADAFLYDTDADMKWSVTANATSSGMQIVDSLGRAIIEAQGSSVGSRTVSLAASMTRSNDALRAYLKGEFYTRSLDWEEAAEQYSRAVAIDTAFALGWLRLTASRHDGGAPLEQRQEAVKRAKQFASQLPDREQRSLAALEPLINGHIDAAVAQLRAYLAVYPNDHEAWYWLGDAVSFWGGLIGHPRSDAIDAYRRSAERGNSNSLFMLAWEYLMAEDPRADSVTEVVRQVGAGGDWVIGLFAGHVFKRGDEGEVRRMLAAIDTMPARQRSNTAGWALWVGNYELAERFARNALSQPLTPEWRADAVRQLFEILMMRGKRVEAERLMGQLSLDARGLLYRQMDAALDPMQPRHIQHLQRLRSRLLAILSSLSATADSNKHQVSDDLYRLARLSVEMRDFAAAASYAQRLESIGIDEDPESGKSLAAGIRAQMAAAQGDSAAALAWLQRINAVMPGWHEMPGSMWYEAERRLRAEILAHRGKPAEALIWYEPFGGPLDMKRRGELYEQSGDRKNALLMYRRLRDLLTGCDPLYRPLRNFAVQRLAVLER